MATKNIVPRATGEGSIGTSAKKWGDVYADDIAVTNGVTASTFTGDLTGDVTGDLTGNVTGDVTGTASGNLALTGGTMTGAISFDATGQIGYRATTHESTPRPCKQLMLSSTDINHWADEGGAKMALHTYDSTGTNTAENGSFGLVATDGTNSADLVGYPDGDLTWKGVSLTDGTLLTTRTVSTPTINSSTSNGITVTPPTVSGYKFVCWVSTSSEGSVFATYIGQATNKAWWVGSTPTGSHIDCTALYVRKW